MISWKQLQSQDGGCFHLIYVQDKLSSLFVFVFDQFNAKNICSVTANIKDTKHVGFTRITFPYP